MHDLAPWLNNVLRRIEIFAVPNLGMLLAGLALLGFVANMWMPVPIDRFYLDPQLVLQGEWWRLFTFTFTSGMTHPIWLLFYCLYVYFICNALENALGTAGLTLYVLLGYLCMVGVAFLTDYPLDLSFFMVEFLTLAFATAFPDYQLHLYGIIPVRAQWLGFLAAGMVLYQFVWRGAWTIPIAFLPYLVFFYPVLWRWLKKRSR